MIAGDKRFAEFLLNITARGVILKQNFTGEILTNRMFFNIDKKYVFRVIAVAIFLKLLLFAFLITGAPESRFLNDSQDYLDTAKTLSAQGTFAVVDNNGSLNYQPYRTPGYPLFLAILQGWMKLPINGVIFIQLLLTLLVALIVYQAAARIDPRIAFLSAVIILYDPPISIFSLIILTETLFLFLIALFLLVFISYLKNNKIYLIVSAALLLIMATYTRPITYYLGIVVTVFIIYANLRFRRIKKAIIHALVFLVLVYSLIGMWESRNYRLTGQRTFSNVIHGVTSVYGLGRIFLKNKDSLPEQERSLVYGIKTASRCFLSLMTRPGPFKYFRSPTVSSVGKIFAYPWMIFWLTGFIFGIVRAGSNIYYQFILLVIAYFIFASIGGVGLLVGERHRVPIMPFIAIISAFGWSFFNFLEKRVKNS